MCRAAVIMVLVATAGCAVAPRSEPFAELEVELGVRFDNVQAALAAVNTSIGDVGVEVQAIGELTVGGGGDSVTAWIYAAIAGAAVLYPVIWRPTRKWCEERKKRKGKRHERTHALPAEPAAVAPA